MSRRARGIRRWGNMPGGRMGRQDRPDVDNVDDDARHDALVDMELIAWQADRQAWIDELRRRRAAAPSSGFTLVECSVVNMAKR